ncbi:MAG: fumarylacetoacetate hydrolase family protein, partial [Phenylobacterium sp.]
MKLASLKNGRDGHLVVVSRDLAWFTDADVIAPTLQAALDDWERCEPMLRGLAEGLEHGAVPRDRFHEHEVASPLPRAYQWIDGTAYGNPPDRQSSEPFLRQGGSDGFLGPRDPIPAGEAAWELDFEAAVAAVTGDVPPGAEGAAALGSVRLLMLCNGLALRGLAERELSAGHGLFQSRPGAAFSPVAVTPDELDGWRDGRLHGPLEVELNGRVVGSPDTGRGVAFDFGRLIAHAARTRRLCAG